MESNEFKLFKSVYNFDEMIVYTELGWSRLKFNNGELYRISHNKLQPLSPAVTEAYLDYQIDSILLSEE